MKPRAYASAIVLCAGFLLFAPSAHATPTDAIYVTNPSGSAQTNYPLQFGRPFIDDEIAQYPQVLVNGTPATTQADVKNRYPDGSVEFAIISVLVPSIPTTGTTTLTFQNQSSGNNSALSQSDMLSSDYDFDADISISTTTGATATTSARTMLANGDYTYWTSGPVATTILLADDSANRKYDMGFDSYKSLRPRFYATFWPTIDKVEVRYVGEDSLDTAWEDMEYNLALSIGSTSPTVVYTQSNVIQQFLTNWTKVFWIGGQPQQQIDVDYNLAYLEATDYFPDFDTSLTVPTSKITSEYSNWTSAAKNLYDKGLWTPYMPTTGGRCDIGLINCWYMQWLYTGDWRSRAVALGQADLASAWGLNEREGDSTKKIDSSQTVSGLGLPLSRYAYKNKYFPDNNGSYSQIGHFASHSLPNANDWVAQNAHTPDPWFVPYVLTGDYYYLEEEQNWAAAQALMYNPGYAGNGTGAGISDEVRGDAWVLRNRANAELITPDSDTTMKHFYASMTSDALAFFEGWVGISDSNFSSTPIYQAGVTEHALGDDPLHFINCQDLSYTDGTFCGASVFEHSYFLIVLGSIIEHGFTAAEPLMNWMQYVLTGQINAPGYDNYNLGAYWIAAKDQSNNWLQSWADLQAVNSVHQDETALGHNVMSSTTTMWDSGNAYPVWATGASSFTTSYDSSATWDWLNTNVRQASLTSAGNGTTGNNANTLASYYNGTADELDWDILPRLTVTNTLPPPPSTKFELNDTIEVSTTTAARETPSTSGTLVSTEATSTRGTIASASATYADGYNWWLVDYQDGHDGYSVEDDLSLVSTAPVVTLSANPTTISPSASSTLTWSSQNVTACSGANFTGSGTSGSAVVSPSVTTTYTINCTGGTASASATVTVTDATPPTVSFVAPTASSTVSDTVALTASSSDNSVMGGVTFWVDSTKIGSEITSTTTTYATTWDSHEVGNGAHTLSAVARDAQNNYATTTESITVANDVTPPLVSITSPASDTNVSGIAVTLVASSSDDTGVAGVTFYIDSAKVGSEVTSGSGTSYSTLWDSTGASEGSHNVFAVARDTSNNYATSTPVTFNVVQLSPNHTLTWDSENDFEHNAAGGIATTTIGTRIDTSSVPGEVTMGSIAEHDFSIDVSSLASSSACGFGATIEDGAACRGYLTVDDDDSGTWTVPDDWNNDDFTIEAIGAGGDGQDGSQRFVPPASHAYFGGVGGGGGEYAEITNAGGYTFTPGATFTFSVAGGGSEEATWLADDSDTTVLLANSGTSGGTGGGSDDDINGSGVGDTVYPGGAGGQGWTISGDDEVAPGGGGGGAAGPSGPGDNGIDASSGEDGSYGAGGAPNGGSPYAWDDDHATGMGGAGADSATPPSDGEAYGAGAGGGEVDLGDSDYMEGGAGGGGLIVVTYTLVDPSEHEISAALATTSAPLKAATLFATSTPGTGSVSYWLSNDGGATWTSATPGTPVAFSATGAHLAYKIRTTGDAEVSAASVSYYDPSTLENLIGDAGQDVQWGKIGWSASIPANTALIFRTRGTSDADGLTALMSAAWSSYYVATSTGSGALDILGNNGGGSAPSYRYLEAEAFLYSLNGSAKPSLDTLSLSYYLAGADTTPPVISSISSGTPGQTSATITWTTDEPATSQVEYGPDTNYGSSTSVDSSLVTSHSVALSNLSPGTTYHFELSSADASSNLATSSDQTFTTASQSSGGGGGGGGGGGSSGSGGGSTTVPPPASTPTTPTVADLQALLSQLMAQYDALVAQLGGAPAGASAPAAPNGSAPARDLTLAAQGADVRTLQQFLNAHGFTITAAGAGSPGNETTYFGALTQAALARFQAAEHISPAAGYFGPVTRALVNQIIAGTATAAAPLPASSAPAAAPAPPPASTASAASAAPLVTPTAKHAFGSRPLSLGMSGTDVAYLQQFLATIPGIYPAKGADTSGYFGTATEQAVSRFQTRYGVTSDPSALGSVGPKTFAEITALGG